jgi:hypothetical protein
MPLTDSTRRATTPLKPHCEVDDAVARPCPSKVRRGCVADQVAAGL